MGLCYRFVGDTAIMCAFFLELVLQIALYRKDGPPTVSQPIGGSVW